MHLKLLSEFGIGHEARQKRREFLSQNGGYTGMRNTLFQKGKQGLNQKFTSFKSNNRGRPGQNGGVQENPRGDQPDKTDPNNPAAKNEWDKKSEESAKGKVREIKADPKKFKNFEAKNREEGIKKVNEAIAKKDVPALRGIVDKAMGDKLTNKEKLDAFGYGDKNEIIYSGKADEDGRFRLYRSKDKENHFGTVEIQNDGSFQFYKVRANDKKREELAEKLGSIKSLDQLKTLDLLYKEFTPKDREDAIKQINEAHKNNNQPNSAGILDKALDQVLKTAPQMPKEKIDEYKLKALGFPNKKSQAKFTSVKDNKFQLYLNGDNKNPAGLINIEEDGSFKYEPYTNETNSQ
jgi:hypothetical protein